MEKHSPSYIQTNHSSEDRDGENYRYFSIKFVKEIEYDDSSSSQEDLDHECREKVRRDWSLKDGSDVKDQQSKKNEEELEVKQLAAIPDTGVTNLIEAWRQQTSHFQTMVEKNDELLEMNLHLMQEMSTIKTNNNHLQEELADVRQYVENMKRDLKQMVPTSTHLSKKYQDLAVSTSDHATCSTASTSSYETTSTSTPTTPWFTVKDPKDDDNLQKNSDIICETPKTSTSGTCTETDKERSCTAISVQKTEKQNYLNSESSHSILMRKFSNDQSSSRTSFVSAVNFDNVILNAHAESNLPSGENTAVNGGQTNPDYRLTRNQLSNDHSNRTEDFTNAFWPIGDQDETPTAEIEDVLIRSSSSLKSSSLLQSSGSHDGSLSKRESWNQITGNRSVTFLDNVTSTSKMENVPEERSNSLMHSFSRGLLERTEDLSGPIQNITAASMSSSKEICVKDSIEEISSLSKQEDKFPFHDALISSDDAHHQSETPSGASGLLNERNDYVDKEPDASDYQNSSLKEKMPVSSSHEKVPLGRSGSPTTAAGPSVWNSDSSCGPLPSPPRYRFMFPCTVSILQEKVKQLRFNEKRAKSASGHEKGSSQRQSAGAHPQDGYQTSNSDRLITAREDGETNSSNLDIRQRDDSLDPRNAWKRLAKTYLSSRGGSRFADLSAQLLYASRIRNLQLATASRPATAPYQRTDSNPRSNGLLRTELSSQGLGTPDAKEVAGFSSSYICIFACHARLVRLDPRGIRCDNKMLHPSVEFVEVQILNLNEPGVYKVVMLSGARVCASHFISKSMILQSLGRSSLSAQKSRSLQETQRDGSVQGSVTRELNPNSSVSQQQGKLDVKDRYKSGSRFAAVVEALRSSKATTTTTQEVTPGGSELTLGSLGPGWIYTALDMSSKPLHMQCFVLVFPTQKLAIQFKAVFNRCREEVQQASDSILVALSTYGRRKTQENANWSCMHSDAGEGAAELMTSSEILKDCQSGCVSCRREAEKSETTKRTDSGAQQRCCCTRVASSGGLLGNNSCTRKPASVGKNGYSTAGVMASNKDCITDSRSEVMTSRRSACQCIFLPASALITRSEPCCSWVEKAGSHRTRGDCWGRCRTEPVNPSFDAWRHSIGGAVGTEDVVFCEESDLDIATYRRETWRKDAERCHNSSEHRVSSLRNCSCNCMNANNGEEATPFADLDNERSSQSFTTAVRVPPITGDSVELHDTMDTMRCSSYEENAHKIPGSTSAESTAAHTGTATQSELRELTQVERSRRDAGFQSRHLKEEEKGRQASCAETVWQSCAPIRAIGLGPETTVEADCLAKSRAKEGRLKGGRQSHGTATDAFFASGMLNTTARSDVDFLSPELQMDTPLWRSLGYLGAEAKDGGPVTSDLNWQGQIDGVTDMTEVFVEYTCSYCQDEDSLSIASDDNFLSLEEDDEENGADEKNAANDPDDPGEAGGNTLPNDPQPTGSHQSTFKGNIAVNLPASVTVQTNTETLERSWGLAGEVIRGEQKEGTHEKPSLGDSEKLMAQPQDVPVAGRALACRSTTCSQISLRSGHAEEKQRARSPAVRHGGHPDFRHHQGPCGVMKRDEARSQNGDGVGPQVQWTWLTGNEPQARRPLSRQDDQAGEHLRRLAEREHHRSGSQGDSRDSRGRLLQHPSGSGNSCSTLASRHTPDSTFAEDEAVVVSRRDAYSFHTPRSRKYRVTGASESRLCRRDSPGRSTTRGDDASPPTTSAGRSQARRGAWPCTAHPGWTDLDGGGVGLSTSCCVRIVREGDRAARLIVTQLKDDVVLCNRVIDAGLIITQPPKKSPGKVVRLVMSAWHKGKRMKVALWLRFRSSKMADQFIVALREAPRIS